jgi:AcrR family transcriptional regulator
MGSFEIDPGTLSSLESEGLVSRTFRRLDPERQGVVVEAIIEEAYRAGPESIAIKRVAERAGAAIGSLYQYFGDRDTMLACAVELVARSLTSQLDSSLPYLEAMPLKEALSAYLSYGIEWSRKESGLLRFFAAAAYGGARQSTSAEAARPGGARQSTSAAADTVIRDRLVRPIAESLQRLIRGIIRAARGRGELRPDCDDERIARIVNALLIVVGDAALMPGLDEYYRLFDEDHRPADMIEAAVGLIARGVMAGEAAV